MKLSEADTVVIDHITPQLEGGRYAVKRISGQDLVVEADILKEGHDLVTAVLKWRPKGDAAWRETPMTLGQNDRWTGTLSVGQIGAWEYTVEAWGDTFRSWQDEVRKKFNGGLRDLKSEALEGASLVSKAAARAGKSPDAKRLKAFASQLQQADAEALSTISASLELTALMIAWTDRSLSTTHAPLPLWVDRERAAYAAWYEFFPRSAEGKADSGSTFRDCLPRIDDAKAMGFDVIYFPPIHPIGETNRKGRNNSLHAEPGEPGVPYAIGNHRHGVNGGGHKDVAPELGTLEDLSWLIGEVKKRGMEIAIDFAINCSPDHPYVESHPEWFFKRPDGTIKYAENPPKKYEDVYPLNFHNDNWQALWQEMRDVIAFWCEIGIRTFRVDNPHTKPVSFWEYLIGDIHETYPDAIFLSEAFTRPKMMQVLAKVGFTQSYTYFTWRNTKWELTEYLTELTQTEMKDYFRGNFFTNTPDILPEYLQRSGRPGFLIRAFLAATLSPVYGIYSGFELCENAPIPGKEEYIDSEKYQFKGRDWNAPGNIKDYVTRLNAIRRDNRALQEYANLRFHPADNDNILFYSKKTVAGDNALLFIVTVDPYNPQTAFVHVPLEELGIGDRETYQVEDLLTGERFTWTGSRNFVSLNPHTRPAHIFRVRRWAGREGGRDVYL
ncbi:starch synthase [Terrimicrobium sacchariphilum]|uniref:Alpha-1,4-glucan:maltose-1-phosphate maltosyltransferase n=1 Tax=Terrimicrobium sacchariphilum TaxID=690879 RepID=A0A146GA20_TERSA|nr:alpha-1,4-glucan--maltose-1-phosphate maltosyltransferase [Terrimicrobium sacchariphilum]GAT34281.1 starch synthase [Terrimicrobium sacchariphilum]